MLEQSKLVAWIHDNLGAELWSAQREIIEAVEQHDRVAVSSCHGAGKSFTAAHVALAFLYDNENSIVITTAPTQRQVRSILWKEIRAAHTRAVVDLAGHPLTEKLELGEDWFAFGFTTSDYDPDKFSGFHASSGKILVIVDEASGVSASVFEGIEGVLSSEGARLLMISNPVRQSGYFADAVRDNITHTIKISAFDTPNFTELGITEADIANGKWKRKESAYRKKHGGLPAPHLVTPKWVADKYVRWGPENPLYVSRVLGELPTEDEWSLIPMAYIQDAQQRTLEPVGDPVFGLDIARMGPDETACYENRGPVVRRVFTMRKAKTTLTAARAGAALDEARKVVRERIEGERIALYNGPTDVDDDAVPRPLCNVDSIGIGAGVFDQLEDAGHNVQEVNFGAAACGDDRHRFANLKAQLYWNMRTKLESGEQDWDHDDEELAAQAAAVQWSLDEQGRIAIESKERVRQRGEDSPDRFEAVVYSYADEIIDGVGRFYFGISEHDHP